jgi:hypothetical protein
MNFVQQVTSGSVTLKPVVKQNDKHIGLIKSFCPWMHSIKYLEHDGQISLWVHSNPVFKTQCHRSGIHTNW